METKAPVRLVSTSASIQSRNSGSRATYGCSGSSHGQECLVPAWAGAPTAAFGRVLIRRTLLRLPMPWSHPGSITVFYILYVMWGTRRLLGNCSQSRMLLLICQALLLENHQCSGTRQQVGGGHETPPTPPSSTPFTGCRLIPC